MPTSTPEPQQKTCTYCNTPAEMLATKCENCGSNLPVALPRPMARLVEAQSHWSMGKTGLVSSGVSILLGVMYQYGIPNSTLVAVLILLWMILILPAMLGISAIATARRKASQFGVNLLSAFGLWAAGLVLVVVGMTLL